jgi:hypothetical protein
MQSRSLVAVVVAVLAASAYAGGGRSGVAQEYPGSMAAFSSDGRSGGLPAAVWSAPCPIPEEEGGCPAQQPYNPGPGGWGEAVSDCARENGGFDAEECFPGELPR